MAGTPINKFVNAISTHETAILFPTPEVERGILVTVELEMFVSKCFRYFLAFRLKYVF